MYHKKWNMPTQKTHKNSTLNEKIENPTSQLTFRVYASSGERCIMPSNRKPYIYHMDQSHWCQREAQIWSTVSKANPHKNSLSVMYCIQLCARAEIRRASQVKERPGTQTGNLKSVYHASQDKTYTWSRKPEVKSVLSCVPLPERGVERITHRRALKSTRTSDNKETDEQGAWIW